jgi:hypothetical protein
MAGGKKDSITFKGPLERGETNISFDNLAKISAGLDLTLAQMLDGASCNWGEGRPALKAGRWDGQP